jgi:hypothetical protein
MPLSKSLEHGMENVIKHFVRVQAGKWTCVRQVEFYGPNGRIQVSIGTTFTRGTNFMGADVARWLDEQYEKGKGLRDSEPLAKSKREQPCQPPSPWSTA